MATPLKIGDIVKVNLVGNSVKFYNVIDITNDKIYLSGTEDKLQLIPDGMGGWKISHELEFMSNNKILSGIKDVDIHIMSQVDDATLSNLCLADKYTAKLCADDTLWAIKINNLGNNFKADKPYDMSFKDYYKWLQNKGVMKLINDFPKIKPFISSKTLIVELRHLLEVTYGNLSGDDQIKEAILTYGIESDHEILSTYIDLVPLNEDKIRLLYDEAGYSGDFYLLNKLYDKGYRPDDLIYNEIISELSYNGDDKSNDIIEWFKTHKN